MLRSCFASFFLSILVTSLLKVSCFASSTALPNFIIINIDDLGYADIGSFGSTLNRTPNLDRMAAEGMRLKCHYAAPVCSPSRSALMTVVIRSGFYRFGGLVSSGGGWLEPEETTIAEVLKSKGYATDASASGI